VPERFEFLNSIETSLEVHVFLACSEAPFNVDFFVESNPPFGELLKIAIKWHWTGQLRSMGYRVINMISGFVEYHVIKQIREDDAGRYLR